VLEIEVATHRRREHELTLRKIPRRSGAGSAPMPALYRKHFLDLGGAGIRDLAFAGRDLLVLSGPPMRGKGTARVRRWPNALASRSERMLGHDHLSTLLELPYHAKKDHAEGIAVLARDHERVLVMVIYDSADTKHALPPGAMKATLHSLPLTASSPSRSRPASPRGE
jgi:hypothetical protein